MYGFWIECHYFLNNVWKNKPYGPNHKNVSYRTIQPFQLDPSPVKMLWEAPAHYSLFTPTSSFRQVQSLCEVPSWQGPTVKPQSCLVLHGTNCCFGTKWTQPVDLYVLGNPGENCSCCLLPASRVNNEIYLLICFLFMCPSGLGSHASVCFYVCLGVRVSSRC